MTLITDQFLIPCLLLIITLLDVEVTEYANSILLEWQIYSFATIGQYNLLLKTPRTLRRAQKFAVSK